MGAAYRTRPYSDMKNQSRLIALSAFTVISVVTIDSMFDGEYPTVGYVMSVSMAYFIIALLTDFGSNLGAMLAVLLMVGTVLERGDDVIKKVTERSNEKKPRKKTSAAAQPQERQLI